MKAVIIGRSQVGLDTIFSSLTGQERPLNVSTEIRQGTALVPDKRLELLAAKFKPKKILPARVDFDLPSAVGDPKEVLKNMLDRAREADALIAVLRNFKGLDGHIPTPWDDANDLASELILNDYITVEKRLERLKEEEKRGKKIDSEELDLLNEALKILENDQALREHPSIPKHPKLRSFGFLSAKPILYVVNNEDDDGDLPANAPKNIPAIAIRGQIEEELAQMEPHEAEEFLADFGVSEPAKNRVIREIYKLMGLISFFTVGEIECRAWTIHQNDTALEAAGVIHSDIQKGFIRAEVTAYEDFLKAASVAEVKKQGLYRLEGKDYVMQDGDVSHFRFNI